MPNHPYPTTRTTPDHAAIQAVWQQTRASVAEYAAHPFALCRRANCLDLAEYRYCPPHARENQAAVERSRARRAEKKEAR